MQELNDILSLIDSYIGGAKWFVFMLLGTGIFFSFYLGFPQFKYFRHALRIVRGKYDEKDDIGDTSHFQALSTALSGTVGTGNIAGVSLAIHLGGPSALFWMLLTAFLGMTTKFVEVLLSHKYREIAEDGTIAGGPMYYMKNRLNWKIVAGIFAFATVVSSFGTGSMPQVNSIASALSTTFGIEAIYTGGVLAVILAFIIIGGIKRIAKVAETLVPTMAIIYFIGAFSVLAANISEIPAAFLSIFSDVFNGTAATGGFLGASVAFAFNRGVNRGLFSNEAGQGSAPIAHAAARAKEPVSEGMVAMLEPFIDTIVICMLTGLTVLSSGVWKEKTFNKFQNSDMIVLGQKFTTSDTEKLSQILISEDKTHYFTGVFKVADGVMQDENVCIMHARSLAENVKFYSEDKLFSGSIAVENGKISTDNIRAEGVSLVHSAPLTNLAFNKGLFGNYGQYIVAIGLLLFAFSTAISWSYYGDRAATYLWGSSSVLYYRIVYVAGFFVASVIDTTIIWTFSGIAIALMTVPNLIGLLVLHKEVKETIDDYWKGFKEKQL
jgi:AGCS family alanine or glycine:cation symporter